MPKSPCDEMFGKVHIFQEGHKNERNLDLTLCSKCQIGGEDFVNFCGLLRKHEL